MSFRNGTNLVDIVCVSFRYSLRPFSLVLPYEPQSAFRSAVSE